MQNGEYSGINKLCQIVPIEADSFLVDGEITDSKFFVWDILVHNGCDLRDQPYEVRYARLTRLFQGVHEVLRVAETAMTPKAKRNLVTRMHEIRAEGFVCKNRNAVYAGGRSGQHFKCKFVATASFIVGPKPDKKAAYGHRSIAVYLLDVVQERFMGTVGVPGTLPASIKDGGDCESPESLLPSRSRGKANSSQVFLGRYATTLSGPTAFGELVKAQSRRGSLPSFAIKKGPGICRSLLCVVRRFRRANRDYDRLKYAAMHDEGSQPFERLTATPRSRPGLPLDSGFRRRFVPPLPFVAAPGDCCVPACRIPHPSPVSH